MIYKEIWDGIGLNNLEKKERKKRKRKKLEKKPTGRQDWALNGKEEAGGRKRLCKCFSLPLKG